MGYSIHPWIFLDLWLYPHRNSLRNSRENKLSPLEFQQNCVTPWKFQGQKARPMEIPVPWVFLEHPWKFCFFFNWPQEFPHILSSKPLQNVLNPPVCFFFWNSPMSMSILFLLHFLVEVVYIILHRIWNINCLVIAPISLKVSSKVSGFSWCNVDIIPSYKNKLILTNV